MEISIEAKARLPHIRLLALDCDGVLTDGKLYFGESGESLKVFHVHDGQGIADWHGAGFVTAVVTGRSSLMLDARAAELGIKFVVQNARDKAAEIERICDAERIALHEVAFVGDDVADISAMHVVGLSFAVANAVPAVKEAAMAVTSKHGGLGAVREVVDLLLSERS